MTRTLLQATQVNYTCYQWMLVAIFLKCGGGIDLHAAIAGLHPAFVVFAAVFVHLGYELIFANLLSILTMATLKRGLAWDKAQDAGRSVTLVVAAAVVVLASPDVRAHE